MLVFFFVASLQQISFFLNVPFLKDIVSHAEDEKNAGKVDAKFMETEMKVKQCRMVLESLDLPFHRYAIECVYMSIIMSINNCFDIIQSIWANTFNLICLLKIHFHTTAFAGHLR